MNIELKPLCHYEYNGNVMKFVQQRWNEMHIKGHGIWSLPFNGHGQTEEAAMKAFVLKHLVVHSNELSIHTKYY